MANYEVNYFDSLSVEEFRQFTDILRYYCKQKGVYYYSVFSSTSSRRAHKAVIHTGRRGRPKSVVFGKPVKPHAHTVIVGNNAHSAAQAICKSLNRKAGKRITKLVSLNDEKHLRNFVQYSARQADLERSNAREFFDQLKIK